MSKYEIDIEGLPEGWRPVAYRIPEVGEHYEHRCQPFLCEIKSHIAFLIIEKIQPRRIVLEETGEERVINKGEWFMSTHGDLVKWGSNLPTQSVHYLWREVKETDLSLTKDDDKLSLSVNDVKELLSDKSWTQDLYDRLCQFIKTKP